MQTLTWTLHVQVSENAEPAAQAVTDQALRPAGKAVAQNAEPAAKSVTDGALRPAGQAVSDNAVPMTKSVMRDQASPSMSLGPLSVNSAWACSFCPTCLGLHESAWVCLKAHALLSVSVEAHLGPLGRESQSLPSAHMGWRPMLYQSSLEKILSWPDSLCMGTLKTRIIMFGNVWLL